MYSEPRGANGLIVRVCLLVTSVLWIIAMATQAGAEQKDRLGRDLLTMPMRLSVINCRINEIVSYVENSEAESTKAAIFLAAVSVCNWDDVVALTARVTPRSDWRLADGSNLLHAAAYNLSHPDVIRLFTDRRDLVRERRDNGDTPEMVAEKSHNTLAVEVLRNMARQQ